MMKGNVIYMAMAMANVIVAQSSLASTTTSLTAPEIPDLSICRGEQFDHYCCFDGTFFGPALARLSSSIASARSARSSAASAQSAFEASTSASHQSLLSSIASRNSEALPTPRTSISISPRPTATGMIKRNIQTEMSSGLTCAGFAAITLSASDGRAQLSSAYAAADATRSTTVVDGSTSVVSVPSKTASTTSSMSSASAVSMTSSSTAGAAITQAPMVMACGAAAAFAYGAM